MRHSILGPWDYDLSLRRTPETGGATASKSEWRRGWGTVDGLTILYIESMQVGVDLLLSVLGYICFSISGCSLAHFGELRGAERTGQN